jgi:hypothetical protein
MPLDDVSVSVPLVAITLVGVTTNVTAVGEVPSKTPPVGVADVQPTVLVTVHPVCDEIAMTSADVSALNVTTSPAACACIAAVHTSVFVAPPAIPAPLMLIVRMSYVVPVDAVEAAEAMLAPVHVTAAAAAQMDFDAVSVIVPPFGIVFAGVTTNVTAVGVLGNATPPVAAAEVHAMELVAVHPVCDERVVTSPEVTASKVTISPAEWATIAAVHVRVSAAPPVAGAPRMTVKVSKLFVTWVDAADVIVSPPLSTQVTAAAAFQMPLDDVSVSVPLVSIALVGVTTNVTAVGEVPSNTPPVGVADVQPTVLVTVQPAWAEITSVSVDVSALNVTVSPAECATNAAVHVRVSAVPPVAGAPRMTVNVSKLFVT